MYRIYWNLHKKCWSIQTHEVGVGWRVTGYADTLMGYGITFHVSEAGRQRVIETGKKNVHAYAVATSISQERDRIPQTWDPIRITYNPFRGPEFLTAGQTPVKKLTVAFFTANGKIWADPKSVRYT